MVSLGSIRTGSLVDSVSEIIWIAQLQGPSFNGHHHIDHFHVGCILGVCDGPFLDGLHWCQGLFLRYFQKVHHYRHLQGQNSSWD